MKNLLIFLILILLVTNIWAQESRKFFCLGNGKCVTVWRTNNNICYIIPGKYRGVLPLSSTSYITSPFTKSMDVIWQANTNDIIVNLEDERSQIIHESPTGIRIINYSLRKRFNDSVFLYFDGNYQRYKKNVDFMTINIKEEYAYGKDGKRLE